MNKFLKKFLCITLFCAVFLNASACGSNSSQKSDIIRSNWNFDEITETKGNSCPEYFVLSEGKYALYSNEYFNYFFEKESYSLEELLDIADGNKNIPDEYRDFVKNFIEKTYDYYPGLEWRMFAYNLSGVTFKKIEVGNYEFEAVAARYLLGGENKIEIREDLDVVNDEFAIRVFRHEMGHMFNSLDYEKGQNKLRFNFKSAQDGKRGDSVLEALDVIFTVDPFIEEYTEDNLGYSILTNVLREIIDCADYPVEASVSNNIEYFEAILDKSLPAGKSAVDFVKNFDYMLTQASNESITENMPELVFIYECTAEMYADKYITKDMNKEEIMKQEKALEERLLKGAPHPEYVYTDVVKRVFEERITK